MPELKAKYGPWALVTGASSGIGAEFARQLARRGLNVILTARRQDRLEALGNELTASGGIETRIVPIDLAERDGPERLCREVESLEVGLLVNNAGVTNTGDLIENDGDAETRLRNIHQISSVYRTPNRVTMGPGVAHVEEARFLGNA